MGRSKLLGNLDKATRENRTRKVYVYIHCKPEEKEGDIWTYRGAKRIGWEV